MKKKFIVIRFANYGENTIFLEDDFFFSNQRTKAKNFDSEKEAEEAIICNNLINSCIVPTYIKGQAGIPWIFRYIRQTNKDMKFIIINGTTALIIERASMEKAIETCQNICDHSKEIIVREVDEIMDHRK